jgi:hypothetical protein
MQTEPVPSSSRARAGSAVGLTFVAVVLVSLFSGGAVGVVLTRAALPASTADPAAGALGAAAGPAGQRRDELIARFRELMLLREIALRERDPLLLRSVWAPGAPGLAKDRAEIARLRDSDRRLAGLRLPVQVFDAFRPGDGSWVVVARLGRSPARLVTGSGHQVRAVKGSAATYRCTLVRRDGRWLLLRFAPS